MATKKSSAAMAGGILAFLGSLVYLYVVFTWYYGAAGGALTPWVSTAQFFGPLVLALAVIGSISLFFMSLGAMMGRMSEKNMMNIWWQFIMLGGIALLILTGGTAWFTYALVGFILSYLGAMWAGM
ncbi:MAG: hypothetical protein LVQ95_05740 [Candidatus Micrarchaeales archaeon]|nr:hypothetical protein [Candidatus Micrarchaeales archaeon]